MFGLSDVEIVALSKCIKDKDLSAARAKIPDASAHQVDFTVHVQGDLTRAGGVAALVARVAETLRAANLRTCEVCCAVLRELKIGPARLERALRVVAPKVIAEDVELRSVFERLETEFADVIPAHDVHTPAKSGNVNVNVTLSKT